MDLEVERLLDAVERTVSFLERDGQTARAVTLARSYATTGGGPLGRRDERGTHPALVPAGQRPPRTRWSLPTGGKRQAARSCTASLPRISG